MKITNQHLPLPQAGTMKEDKELRRACADFEALITNQMLTTMRNSLPREDEGLFAKSYAETMFQSMLDEELAKEMSRGKGMGLGEMLYQNLLKNSHK